MGSTNQYNSSSGYRFQSTNVISFLRPTSSSQFHSSCVPKETRERIKSAPPKSQESRSKDYSLCNHVNEDRTWIERCKKERTLQNTWERKFDFLTEFDQKGNLRPKPQISESSNQSRFSPSFPSASSRVIGRRCQSAPARRMQSLEQSMHRGKRRNKDLVYHD
eukprot:gene1392-1535_t